MIFREAQVSDIAQMQIVRNAVKENMLSDPNLVPDEDYIPFITEHGKGWVCIIDDQVVGFSIIDLKDENVWALFLDPVFEGKGIGRYLHKLMLDWYFDQGKEWVWLGTEPGTRAEAFYRKLGWIETGMNGRSELKFEMTKAFWLAIAFK
jgi:GNAT superfamily N-acetyltransferase